MKSRNLIEAIKHNLVQEDEYAAKLIAKSRKARTRGYLTKKEFLDICMWKSPRPKKHYEKNTEDKIADITKRAFLIPHEKNRIVSLTRLNGIKIPTASAILAMVYPDRYGIIDIRVWKVLRKYEEVKDNPRGMNFTPAQWYKYLVKLRYIAKKLKKTPRIVELTMFYHSKQIQKGNLYG